MVPNFGRVFSKHVNLQLAALRSAAAVTLLSSRHNSSALQQSNWLSRHAEMIAIVKALVAILLSLVVKRWSRTLDQRSYCYSTSDPVNIWMGDRLRAGV